MAVLRLGIGLVALGASLWLFACTERNPKYCDNGQHGCPIGLRCDEHHACVLADADAAADADEAGDGGPDVAARCTGNNDCRADGGDLVCDQDAGTCVGCLVNEDCAGANKVCDAEIRACVPCLVSSQCLVATAPVCDAKVCRACKADSECAGIGPGVCLSNLDGHCATDDETIYVQKSDACSDAAASGSSGTPFCSTQAGINAFATASGSSKRLVVMRGPVDLPSWSYQGSATLTVVGQLAVIKPGANVGIQIGGGVVYVRNLRVTGGSYTGVVAAGGALHLDRCIIDANALGGIQINGAGFDITNTVIANNLAAPDSGGVSWGGIRISQAVPSGSPSRLLNDTIVNNGAAGFSCASPYPISGSILFGNTTFDNVGCTVVTCCAGNPQLTSDYHFMSAQSPCVDKLPAAMSLPFDMDGQARPYGVSGLSDCGADEYMPAALP
jgi:hypothetical protein